MLSVGTNVDIQRTDGRVHSAIVSGINTNTNSVTVEWYEKGEAKGKEIELEAIFQLNPNLRRIIPSPEKVSGIGDVTKVYAHKDVTGVPNDLHDATANANAVSSSTHADNPASRFAPPSRIPAQSRAVPVNNINNRPPVSQEDRAGQSRSAHATTHPTVADQSRHPHGTPSHRLANGHSAGSMSDHTEPATATAGNPLAAAGGGGGTDSDAEGLTQLADMARDPDTGSLCAEWMDQDSGDMGEDGSTAPGTASRPFATDGQRRVTNRVTSSVLAAAAANANSASAVAPRKSNCVKEIERIQQRREERRAAQRAVRDQVELDPSNPSYEFHTMINEYRNTLDYRPITNTDPIEDHQICVCVRKRPMNKKEIGRKEIDVITIPNKQMVIVHEPKTKVDLTKYLENQQFRFDYTFDDTTDNELVYRYTAQPLVESIFERGMATCFAYGQTGSGKTHTMGGEFNAPGQQNCTNGIYALAAADLFNLNSTKYRHEKLRVDAAFFEIYSGKVFDLLNKKNKLRVLEDAKGQVQVVGLREEPVHSVDAVLRLLQHGQHIRTSGQTSANQHSSRSHAVFQLILKRQSSNKIHGKFSLIDLAGNERGVDTSSSDRHTRMEGAEINKSLLALKECIRALGRKGAHLPFRASKLTQVLRDSFIGDRSRTCMIAMISPGMSSCEHTLNTLRYANRVKELGPAGLSSSGSNTDLPPISARNGPTTTASSRPNAGAPTAILNAAGAHGDVNGGGGGGSLLPPTLRAPYLGAPQTSLTGPTWNYSQSGLPSGNEALLEDDDLAMLRSANDGEVTDDLLTFQEVITQIERMEEEVCDDHRALCASMTEWTKEHFRLHKISNQVEFDVEAYSAKLEQLLTNQINVMSSLKDKISVWRRELRQEEELSNKLQRGVRF